VYGFAKSAGPMPRYGRTNKSRRGTGRLRISCQTGGKPATWRKGSRFPVRISYGMSLSEIAFSLWSVQDMVGDVVVDHKL
jgi:hypothetical protein